MGTGSGFYDDQMMRQGQCAHCGTYVSLVDAVTRDGERPFVGIDVSEPSPFPQKEERIHRFFSFFQCPSCNDVTVWMMWHPGAEAGRELSRIYPVPRSDQPGAPAETPSEIVKAYEEACRVLPVSASAAAALARRALQMILREVVGVSGNNLYEEIEASRGLLAGWLVDALHDLRKVGNFAVHPSKDELTGGIVEPEPGEAELTVDLVAALLHHLYAGRQAAKELAERLANRRLQR